MKWYTRLLLVGLLLLVLAGGAAILLLDTLVCSAVEKGGTLAAGTPTTLEEADVSFFSKHFGLEGFAIANPAGFRSEPFLALAGVHADWKNGSVFADPLVIDSFTLDGLQLNLERSAAGNNWDAILDSLKKLSGDGPAKPDEPEAAGSGRSVTIGRLSIRNTRCALRVSGMPDPLNGEWKVEVPAIEIENLSSNGSTAEIASKLTGAVVQAVVKAAATSGKGVFQAEALKALEGDLKQLGKGVLDDVLKGDTKPDDALERAKQGLEGLFGGKKK